jgi:DNA repair protein RadC
MSQLSLSIESSLLVRDVAGQCRPANADEVLKAAQRLMGAQLRGSVRY